MAYAAIKDGAQVQVEGDPPFHVEDGVFVFDREISSHEPTPVLNLPNGGTVTTFIGGHQSVPLSELPLT